jgi:hypothetical protein
MPIPPAFCNETQAETTARHFEFEKPGVRDVGSSRNAHVATAGHILSLRKAGNLPGTTTFDMGFFRFAGAGRTVRRTKAVRTREDEVFLSEHYRNG